MLICEHLGQYYAHSTICPHQGNSLDGARLWGRMIECPWHHYEFDVASGENGYPSRVDPGELLGELGDTVQPLRTFPLERRGHDLYVAFPSDQ